MYARPFIDSSNFARNGQRINGEAPVAELPRLLEELDNPQAVLHYTVQGGVDKQGVLRLGISVTGQCQLRCQRCLGALDYPLELDVRLLLRDQAELDALDESVEEEEYDSVLADAHLDVLELLEEEILLSLPIAPKHESGGCQAADGGNTYQDEKNPFAVLEQLKRS